MKKTKLFTLLSSAVLVSTAIPTISSCANTQNHVWLVATDKPTKDADANLKAKYIFGLDGDYETKDVKVTISSENKSLFLLNYFISNNIVVIEVQYLDVVEEKTPVKFSVQFATKNWTQTINDLVLNVPVTLPADFIMLRKINRILANNKANTMKDALKVVKDNDIDIEKLVCEETNDIYIWDQKVNRFVIINSLTETIHYKTDDYQENSNKWQLWKMVDQDSFDEYSEYSQYLKVPSSNALTKIDYSFISGFDCGNNTDVRNVHYFYYKNEEANEPIAKDIIINTNSNTTNVDISAWDGNGSDGDTVTHYGTMGELTVVTNDKYVENGKVITCSVYDGEIEIAADANIEMTHVKADVTLTDFKQSGSLIDKIYVLPDYITEVQKQYPEATEATEAEYQEVKEEVYEEEHHIEVSYVFDVYDSLGQKTNSHFNSLTEISAVTNATDNPEFFEDKTIVLNKDYDMSIESDGWVPICNYDDDTGSLGKAFAGTIDGQEHTILNFNLNVSTGNPGLINSNAGSVKNLNFKNCSLNNSAGRACLVAVWSRLGNMTFENLNFYNCNVTSQRSNGFALGYITGSGTNAVIKNCYTDNECWIKGTTYHYLYQTGFVSQVCDGVSSVLIENCEMRYKVQSVYCAGSYIGQLGSVNSQCPNVTFKNCTSYGDVVCIEGAFAGNGPMMGGFVGSCQNNAQTETESTTVLFDHCTNYSNVYAEDKFVNVDSIGGFIGYGNNPIKAGSVVSFVDCVNQGNIGKENEVTGYIPNYSGGFFGRTNANENLTIQFTRCENKGYINATKAGHFMGLLDYSTEAILAKRTCTDCIISGSLRDPKNRTKITGEPA